MRRAFWLFLLLLSGCATAKLPPQDLQEIYGRLTRGEVSGYASFLLQAEEREVVGQAFVSAGPDGSFRIDVVDPFLRPLYSISYSRGRLTFLAIRDNRSYKRRVPPGGRVVVEGIAIVPIALSSAILGYPPVTVEDGSVERKGGLYHLTLRAGGLHLRLVMDPDGWVPLGFRVYAKGNLIYSQKNTFEGGGLKEVEAIGEGYRLRMVFSEWRVR